MANVSFYRGSQANLNAMTSYEDGRFYLTTDTDRLYVAQSANELVELNKSITIIDSISDLPTSISDNSKKIKGADVAVGQFYYINGNGGANTNNRNGTQSGGNILAVCSDIASNGAITWTQVNPDTDTNTNDNTKVTSISATKNASSDNTKLVFDLSVGQTTSHLGTSNTNETAVTGTLTINSSDVTGILTDTAVDVDNSAVSSNKTTIATTGSGSSGSGFTIEGSSNVTLTDTTTGIKIDAKDTQYNLTSPAVSGASAATSAAVNLGIVGGNTSAGGTITVKAGEDLAIDNTTAGEFTIYHKNSGATAGSYGTSASTTPAAGGKIKIPNITVDAQGHLTAASEQEITLPADKDSYITSVTAAATGGTFSVTHAGSRSNTVTSGEVLFYNIDKYAADGTKTTTKVDNQGNLGEYYTKTAIDDLLKGINAVTYKGTVFGTGATAGSTLPTTKVKIGDAYLANADSGNYKQGDLIIATGTEGADGTITAGTLQWTRVPSGKDADTTYTFAVDEAANKVTVTPLGTTALDVVKFAAGDALDVSTSGKTVTFSHEDVTRSDTGSAVASPNGSLSAGSKFTAVTNVTSSDEGHVTGVRFTEFTLPADRYTTYAMGVTAGTPAINLTASGTASGTQTVTFDAGTDMSVSATANKITYNHGSVTRTDTGTATANPTTTLSAGGKFKAITNLTTSAQGHVTAARFTEFTLPADKDTTYTMSVTSGTPTINLVAGGSGSGNKGAIAFSSDNLTVTAPAANSIKMNLEWGTF